MIWLLDVIADLPETGADIDKAIRAVVQALGILIGFSWEKAFDTAVEGVSDFISFFPPSGTKLGMAIVLAAVVVPAWRMHILPTILAFEEEEEEEEEQEEKAKDSEKGIEDLSKPLLNQ